jgi:septal ring-binding cell division protein DamX
VNPSKHELFVFSRREAVIIVFLLALVSLFSFTVGIKMGKQLASTERSSHEQEHDGHAATPMHEAETPESAHEAEGRGAADETNPHAAVDAAEHTAHQGEGQKDKATPSGADLLNKESNQAADNVTLQAQQRVQTNLPSSKKGIRADAVMFTLQVGAYRSVAEAAEQVSVLKRAGFDNAFYFEAHVPGKGVWYRVGIGSYGTKADAENAARMMTAQKKSLPTFIVQQVGQ